MHFMPRQLDELTLAKFAPSAVPGVFMGHELHSDAKWTGGYSAVDSSSSDELDFRSARLGYRRLFSAPPKGSCGCEGQGPLSPSAKVPSHISGKLGFRVMVPQITARVGETADSLTASIPTEAGGGGVLSGGESRSPPRWVLVQCTYGHLGPAAPPPPPLRARVLGSSDHACPGDLLQGT